MVYSGLEFGQFFELSGQAGCRDIFIAITPICRMVLCIAQVQFIFLNTTYLDMARHKVFSRFGLMHMVGTNLCEWLYVLVEETKHEIFHIAHHEAHHDADHDAAIAAATLGGGVDWAAVNATLHVNHHLGEHAQNSTIAAVVTHVLNNVTATTTEMSMEADGHGCSRTTIMGALVQVRKELQFSVFNIFLFLFFFFSNYPLFFFPAPLNIPLSVLLYCTKCGKPLNPYRTLTSPVRIPLNRYTKSPLITFQWIVLNRIRVYSLVFWSLS